MRNKATYAHLKHRFELRFSDHTTEYRASFREYDGPGFGSSNPGSKRFTLQSGVARESAALELIDWYSSIMNGESSSKTVSIYDIASWDKHKSTVQSIGFTDVYVISMRHHSAVGADRLAIESIDFHYSHYYKFDT